MARGVPAPVERSGPRANETPRDPGQWPRGSESALSIDSADTVLYAPSTERCGQCEHTNSPVSDGNGSFGFRLRRNSEEIP